MNKSGKILSISPHYAIPGGEILLNCEGVSFDRDSELKCWIGNARAKIIGATQTRILVTVPEEIVDTESEISLEVGDEINEPVPANLGVMLARDFHIVANPVVDPRDGTIIVTRSGTRGQYLPVTLFRVYSGGAIEEFSHSVLNPTGLAFDSDGLLCVTNRSEGEVVGIDENEDVRLSAGGFGIATGIAFDSHGTMFVGDRSGRIFRYDGYGEPEVFATLEASVAAFHLAFDARDNLYVSAPGLSSYDSIHKINREGEVEIFSRGFGRPQGLAFDTDGNLYVAACLRGRRGIIKISPDGRDKELFVSGMNVVGLCFTGEGDMIVASGEAIYRVPVGIRGLLLRDV